MSTVTLPGTIKLSPGCGVGQRRFDLVTQSDSSGSQQARLLGPPRWTLRLVQPDFLTLPEAGLWAALALQLRGRVNVLAAWDPARPAPSGTLRGTLTLAASAAAGDTKAATEMLRYAHGWVAKQAVEVNIEQKISITAALEEAQRRVITLIATDMTAEDTPALADARLHR